MDYYNKMNLCIHITIYMHSTLDNPLMIGLLLLSKMGASIYYFFITYWCVVYFKLIWWKAESFHFFWAVVVGAYRCSFFLKHKHNLQH